MKPAIIVSGASSALGNVLCQQLALNDYHIYAGYNRSKNKLYLDKSITPIKLDITDYDACEKVITRIVKKEKKIFALINLVAISPSGYSLDFDSKDLQNILDINVVGPFGLIKEILPHLPVSGRIINIGSLSGLISFPRFSLYSASKFALRALSLGLYYEWLPKKRYITHVAPGAIAKDPPTPPPPGSARQRVPLINWLFPLVTPQRVSGVIIDCLKDSSPPAEILIGTDTIVLSMVRRLTPELVWNKLQNFVWQKQQ